MTIQGLLPVDLEFGNTAESDQKSLKGMPGIDKIYDFTRLLTRRRSSSCACLPPPPPPGERESLPPSGQTKQNFRQKAETETSTPRKAEISSETKFLPKHYFRLREAVLACFGLKMLQQNMIFQDLLAKIAKFWPKKVFWPNHRKRR